jgi:hypothetical protein
VFLVFYPFYLFIGTYNLNNKNNIIIDNNNNNNNNNDKDNINK